MFKHIRQLLCVSLLLTSSAFASVQDVLNEPMFANDEPTSFLWEINYQGENVGALFGTYHIGKIGTVLPDKVKEYLLKSDQLITENAIAFQSQNDLAAQSSMMMSFLASPQTIDERFPPKTALLLKEYLSSKGIPEDQQDKVTDMFVFMLIAIDIGPDYSAEYGIEHLMGQFVMLNKQPTEFKNIGLEQLLESINILEDAMGDNFPQEVAKYFEYREVLNQHSREMLTCYERNDVKCLLTEMLLTEQVMPMTAEEQAQADAMMRKINEDRNYQWLPKLRVALHDENSGYNLIAVGGLHLFGKEGLIELLRKEGFELTPVHY